MRPKRWHLHVHSMQPVVKVQPESPQLDQPRERAVGRHDDPRVDPARAEAADALDGQILNGAQELGLCGRRQVGHFIEKERPLVGVLELPAATAHARRRAFLYSKELGLEQGLDDRGAVDGDEGALAPATELVNLPGDELLARARFTLDENGEICRGDALDSIAHGPNREARTNQRRRAVDTIAAGMAPSLSSFNLEDEPGDMRRSVQ